MNFDKLGVAKFIVSGVVGIGTGKIVSSIIKSHVTPTTLVDKVTIAAASWVIGGIATERAKAYVDDTIDYVVQNADNFVSHVKLQQKLSRVNRGDSTLEKEGLSITNFRKNAEGKWERIKDEAEQEKVEV